MVRGKQCQGGDIPREVAAAVHGARVPPLTSYTSTPTQFLSGESPGTIAVARG